MNTFLVTLIFQYGVSIPVQLNEEQLTTLVRLHSRPKWLMPRNFGYQVSDKQYIKIDLRRLMFLSAERNGIEDVLKSRQ